VREGEVSTDGSKVLMSEADIATLALAEPVRGRALGHNPLLAALEAALMLGRRSNRGIQNSNFGRLVFIGAAWKS
jgi:hypothetical protein